MVGNLFVFLPILITLLMYFKDFYGWNGLAKEGEAAAAQKSGYVLPKMTNAAQAEPKKVEC
jgi:hypothetical protein